MSNKTANETIKLSISSSFGEAYRFTEKTLCFLIGNESYRLGGAKIEMDLRDGPERLTDVEVVLDHPGGLMFGVLELSFFVKRCESTGQRNVSGLVEVSLRVHAGKASDIYALNIECDENGNLKHLFDEALVSKFKTAIAHMS